MSTNEHPPTTGETKSRVVEIVNRVFGRPSAVPTVPVLPERHALGQHGIVADAGTFANGLVSLCSASVQGLSHRSVATTRQDNYSFAAEGNRIVCAVADGLGSAALSHLGSETAARTAVSVAIAGGGPTEIAAAVSAAIRIAADRINQSVDMLATTLATLVVEIGAPGRPWTVNVAEWGDTRATVYRPQSIVNGHPDWRRLATADQDEVFANAVRPLPHCPHPRAQGTYEWMPGEMLLLATDGVDAQLVASNPVGHNLAGAWEHAPSIWQFIADVGFDRAGARDDRTAVCLWRAAILPTESAVEVLPTETMKPETTGTAHNSPTSNPQQRAATSNLDADTRSAGVENGTRSASIRRRNSSPEGG
jgi:hypothetical protein